MEKSLYSEGYALFLRQLRAAREAASVTQVEFGKLLGESQSFVSKCERGERRIDVVELHQFCLALGISFSAFTRGLDEALASKVLRRSSRKLTG